MAVSLNHLMGSQGCFGRAAGRYYMKEGFIKVLLVTGFVFLTTSAIHNAQAGEHRQHGTHEHGVAQLNVAVEGSQFAIELSSPAANIVGFEHPPQTQAQKEQVKEARKKLKAAQTLFKLPANAQARLVKSTVDSDIDRDSGEAPDERHTHEHTNVHDEKGTAGHEHHDDGHGHEHHSDFKAEYHFICTKPDKLAYLDVMLFQVFPGIERMEVQILTDTGQTARELTAQDYRITF
jgi:hypothetical protein